MDLRQLRFFLEIAECGGFTKAAERLFIAQSALSTAIKKLEEELEVELFSRKNKKVTLTQEGQLLAERAKAIFDIVDKSKQEIADIRNLAKGEVKVGFTPIMSSFFFPHIISSFKHEYPQIKLSVFCGRASDIQIKVNSGELDLGMIIGEAPDSLESHHIIKEEVVACVPENHRFASATALPRKELLMEPLLVFSKGYVLRQIVDDAAAKEGISPDIAVEANLFSLLRSLVKEGMGTAFMLRMAAANTPGVKAVSCNPKMFMDMYITWEKESGLSMAAKVFTEYIKREIDDYYMQRQAATTFPLP